MKVFQIVNGFCHYDATRVHPTIEGTVGKYAPNIVFVETPDYVFEGWGYDETKDGDERFIKPIAPDGWTYDDASGTFIEDRPAQEHSTDTQTDAEQSIIDEAAAAYEEGVNEA